MNRAISFLVLLSALPLAGAQATPPPPVALFVIEGADETVLVWIPPAPLPEGATFNVYGVLDGGFVPLGSVPAPIVSWTGPDTYAAYAVTAVVDAAESAPVMSCVNVAGNPPDVSIGYNPSECAVLTKIPPGLVKKAP